MSLKIEPTVLDDLCSRFLLNIPQSEKEDMVRLCFQIELAHWFYLDFFRPENSRLPDCRMREFTKVIFKEYPFLLNPKDCNVDDIIERWKEYKRNVPTYGAILLDSALEHVLLVQGFWIKASWGFPKGKVNKAENPDACAVREVLEETGFDITGKVDKTQYAEHSLNEQLSRLYYVTDVPMDTEFKPKTRGEIKSVQWFNVNDLPVHKKDNTPKRNLHMSPNCFFMVIPFVKQIKRWIAIQKSKSETVHSVLLDDKMVNSKTRQKDSNKNSATHNSISAQNMLSTTSASQGNNRVLSESAKRQMQLFHQKNNMELEMINHITNRSPISRKSPQQRGPGFGRGSGDHFYKPPVPEQPSLNSTLARGRSLYSGTLPDAWKYFAFDRDHLTEAINSFH